MRVLWLFLLGCTPSSSAPPAKVDPAPSVTGVASSAPVASSGAPTIVEAGIPPLDLGLGFPPALLERLAKEADAQPAGKLVLKPPPDAERDESIKKRFGQNCRLERTCGPLWGIDCQAAVDGPYEYVRVRKDRLEQITTCGGACMGGRCTNCPPKKEGWTCPTY